MALRAKVVNLIGLHLLDDPDQVGAVSEVSVMQHQTRITHEGPDIVIDPARVEAAGAPLDAMHLVAFSSSSPQGSCRLAGNAGDQSGFELRCWHAGDDQVMRMWLRCPALRLQEAQERYKSSRGSFTKRRYFAIRDQSCLDTIVMAAACHQTF